MAYSLSQWLNNQVISAILVNERTTQSKMSKIIEKYQIKITKLLNLGNNLNMNLNEKQDKNNMIDERQLIFSSLKYPINQKKIINSSPLKMTFPNVPFYKN